MPTISNNKLRPRFLPVHSSETLSAALDAAGEYGPDEFTHMLDDIEVNDGVVGAPPLVLDFEFENEIQDGGEGDREAAWNWLVMGMYLSCGERL